MDNSTLIYIVRRILYLIPVLLGVCLLIFVLFNVAGNDPAASLLGKNATAEQLLEVREELGLNKPMIEQYFDVVKSAFTFDFGRSWTTKQKITDMLAAGAMPSLTVSLPAFVISTILGVIFAMLVAHYRGTGVDNFVRVAAIAMMSISSLVYILFFQWLFAYKLNLFEIMGYEEGFPYFIPYIILPVIIWVIVSIGPDVRFFRTIFLDEMYQDYVRTAKAKGLSDKKVLFKHILRNAMIPILTYTVVQLPFLLMGALLIESFFGIPGLGDMTISALNSSDFPVLKALAILSAVAYVIFTMIQDILYTLVDPRVKLR
jgi:peptide/nickel transport system permease protein